MVLLCMIRFSIEPWERVLLLPSTENWSRWWSWNRLEGGAIYLGPHTSSIKVLALYQPCQEYQQQKAWCRWQKITKTDKRTKSDWRTLENTKYEKSLKSVTRDTTQNFSKEKRRTWAGKNTEQTPQENGKFIHISIDHNQIETKNIIREKGPKTAPTTKIWCVKRPEWQEIKLETSRLVVRCSLIQDLFFPWFITRVCNNLENGGN